MADPGGKIYYMDSKAKIVQRIQEHVEAGRVAAMLTVAVLVDGTWEVEWSEGVQFATLIGAVETAKLDLYARTVGLVHRDDLVEM